jgi:RNA polymerase sigma-70 factor (ECF subfamily)
VKDFEEIYSEYYDIVFQYVLSLCREETWAEEITQEAFFQALKNIDTFRGECKLSVWLCQIAKNKFCTEAKKRKRQVDYPLEIIPTEDAMEQKIFDKETALELHKLLHQLNEPYKEVFWMRTFGELSFAEIGSFWEKSESWARVTYHRAKMKMKEGAK